MPAVLWLILSFLDQGCPIAFVCRISQTSVLAGYSPVQYHATASSWKCGGLHLLSCDWNAQQFMGGWKWAAFKKSKEMQLWSGLFYCFSPPSENLQRFSSLLWKLSKPCSMQAVKLAALCVMAAHSSWLALCSLAIGNALNKKFSLTFITLLLRTFLRW